MFEVNAEQPNVGVEPPILPGRPRPSPASSPCNWRRVRYASGPRGAILAPMTTLDFAALDRLRADIDPVVLPSLVASFIAEARDRARRAKDAAAARDFSALEHESHTLKSSALTFGACALHDCMAAVEHACLEGRAEDAVALVQPAERLAAAAGAALGRKFPSAGEPRSKI